MFSYRTHIYLAYTRNINAFSLQSLVKRGPLFQGGKREAADVIGAVAYKKRPFQTKQIGKNEALQKRGLEQMWRSREGMQFQSPGFTG
jgi:hypothetical protein